MKKPRPTSNRDTHGDAPVPRGQHAANEDEDKVREASEESFPASDPPSFTATTGSIADGPDVTKPKQRR